MSNPVWEKLAAYCQKLREEADAIEGIEPTRRSQIVSTARSLRPQNHLGYMNAKEQTLFECERTIWNENPPSDDEPIAVVVKFCMEFLARWDSSPMMRELFKQVGRRAVAERELENLRGLS